MKKFIIPAALALAVTAAPALAADLSKPVYKAAPAPAVTPAWDVAFGGVVMSDYNFRGVSQSNKGPSGGAYFEPQFTTAAGTFYVGVAGVGINWPSAFSDGSVGLSSPSAEIDFYGGWRNTWGALSLDLGYWYYYYPKEQFNIDSDFWEIYAKVAYAVTPDFTIGANIFYTPDMLNYGAVFANAGFTDKAEAIYASATAKWTLSSAANGVGAFLSGELGHWWIEDGGFINMSFSDPSYTYYNAGIGFTYKALTLDLRYHGTNMNQTDCGAYLLVGTPHATNNWCNDTFIVSLKADTSINALK